MWWLVLAYFLLEVGEMCLSPIGLSAVTQLSVARVVGLMMGGFWLGDRVLGSAGGAVRQAGLDRDSRRRRDRHASTLPGKYGDLFQLMLWIGLGSALVFLCSRRC